MQNRFIKFLFLVVLLVSGASCFGQGTKFPVCQATSTTSTTNLGLIKPGHCVLNWDTNYNHDMDVLDAAIHSLQLNGGSSSGGSGNCGSVLGDDSSVTCGVGNRSNDTASNPANVIVVGYDGLSSNNYTQVVAVGSTPVSGALTGSPNTDLVGVGNNPLDFSEGGATFDGGNDLVGIGDNPIRIADGVGAYITQAVAIGDSDMYAMQGNNWTDLVAIGDKNLYNLYDTGYTVAIGTSNGFSSDNSGDTHCNISDSVLVGLDNALYCEGSGYGDAIGIGDNNLFVSSPGSQHNSASFSYAIAIGSNALEVLGRNSTNHLFHVHDAIAIGDDAVEASEMQDVIGIGDVAGGANNGPHQDEKISDIVAIGDSPGWVVGGSSVVVAIGLSPVICPYDQASAFSEVIGIGDSSASCVDGSHDVIGIGDESIHTSSTLGPSSGFTTGHDLIGLGNHALSANIDGHDNIAIGDYAGSLGYVDQSTDGNSITSGSENVLIGDTIGPCDTNANGTGTGPGGLSETVILGDHACLDGNLGVMLSVPMPGSLNLQQYEGNIGIGIAPLVGNTGGDNVAIGTGAGEGGLQWYAVAIGDNAGVNLTAEGYAVAIGASAGLSSQTGDLVAIGDSAAEYTTGGHMVILGDTEASFLTGGDVVSIGHLDLSGANPESLCTAQDVVVLGDENASLCIGTTFENLVVLGNDNLQYPSGSNTYYATEVIALGLSNFDISGTMPAGHTSPVTPNMNQALAIGWANGTNVGENFDTILIGDGAGGCNTSGSGTCQFVDLVAIGDGAGRTLNTDSVSDVFIGVSAVGNVPVGTGSGSALPAEDDVAIGASALQNGTGTEIIAIGTQAVGGLTISGTPIGNIGDHVIGIGDFTLAANQTGTENIAIGDYAGCPGCTQTSVGHGTTTGSNQILIGNSVGQSSTTQLDDIVVIGDHATADASNEVVIGSSSTTTKTELFGDLYLNGVLVNVTSGTGDGTGTTVQLAGTTLGTANFALSGITPDSGYVMAKPKAGTGSDLGFEVPVSSLGTAVSVAGSGVTTLDFNETGITADSGYTLVTRKTSSGKITFEVPTVVPGTTLSVNGSAQSALNITDSSMTADSGFTLATLVSVSGKLTFEVPTTSTMQFNGSAQATFNVTTSGLTADSGFELATPILSSGKLAFEVPVRTTVEIAGTSQATVDINNTGITPDSGYQLATPKTSGTKLTFEVPISSPVGLMTGQIGGFQQGLLPSSGSSTLLLIPIANTTVFPSGCTNSRVGAKTGATSTSVFTLYKHAGGPAGTATVLCTASFASGSSGSAETATVSGSGGTASAGDYVEIVGPASQDPSLANIGLAFYETH